MADLLIRGMEMPTCCAQCPFSELEPTKAMICCPPAKMKISYRLGKIFRPDQCPLIPLPHHHGDLIDRDALVYDEYEKTWLVHSARVIIPASD